MELSQTVDKLCRLSRECFSPLPAIDSWPESLAPDAAWYFSPELLSLAGTAELGAMSEGSQKRLSFYENINFFSLNIHGERFLLAGMAERLYGRRHRSEYQYLHHFLDEENKHLHYFGTFCQKFAGKIYPDRKLAFAAEHADGEEDFLFFFRVLVFEEIADFVNVRTAEDERVLPFVREVHRMHHADEVRHLAFGRLLLADIHERWWPRWSEDVRSRVRQYVEQYLSAVWSEYYAPDMFRDAGLENCYELSRVARQNGASMRRSALRRPRQLLAKLGLTDAEEQP